MPPTSGCAAHPQWPWRRAVPRSPVVAVHKEPVPIDLLILMSNEITSVGSMRYPDEIVDVTKDLSANWETYARIVIPHTGVTFRDC